MKSRLELLEQQENSTASTASGSDVNRQLIVFRVSSSNASVNYASAAVSTPTSASMKPMAVMCCV